MQGHVRVDLLFPRSGQVLPIYVPGAMMELVADRNLQILLSFMQDASSSYVDARQHTQYYLS